MLSDIEKKEKKKIHVLDVIRMSTKSWKNVKKETIVNCFKKSGFSVENVVTDDKLENSIPEVSKQQWENIHQHLGVQNICSFDEFVDVDYNAPTDGKLSDKEIINSVT